VNLPKKIFLSTHFAELLAIIARKIVKIVEDAQRTYNIDDEFVDLYVFYIHFYKGTTKIYPFL
jgi:hypothetical protein